VPGLTIRASRLRDRRSWSRLERRGKMNVGAARGREQAED
jgi:hypothetical protein